MDARAVKLAIARKKLKDHQEKKNQEISLHIEPNNSSPSKNDQNIEIPETSKAYNNNVTKFDEIESTSHNLELLKEAVVVPNYQHTPSNDVNATEILISNKQSLELQIHSLQTKMMELENNLTITTQNYDGSCQKIINLENDLKNVNYKYQEAADQILSKDATIKELSNFKSSLQEKQSNLQEQLELTKSILKAKEVENGSLHSQLFNIQNQLEVTQLQLQQLTSGAYSKASEEVTTSLNHENDILTQKVSSLEQQLKTHIKDYQQLNNHYEHYVNDLNSQFKQVVNKNGELTIEMQVLLNREKTLIEQIGNMETQLQNYKKTENMLKQQCIDTSAIDEIRVKYEGAQQSLQDLGTKYEELQKLYAENKAQLENLTNSDTQKCSENVSLLKLNADITSDKIAAQRATEQNKKLKQDIQGLEDAFVKMTKDKLELTEKLTAEKFLNRELTIKLAEIDENANEMQKKLKAKDEEMIRLQTSCRIIEEKYNAIAENLKHLNGNNEDQENMNGENNENDANKEEISTSLIRVDCPDHNILEYENTKENANIPKGNAMVKLQERFLKIMNEVADLSDEKHRLEHIITQLQNETDTICEYVALYQQQRSLLKKRDEERNEQIKMFQIECTKLQSQLDELTGILTRFADDKALSSYFQVEAKQDDIQKVMKLLLKLKTNSLIDPQKSFKFNDFYPCSCCSGQLIEV